MRCILVLLSQLALVLQAQAQHIGHETQHGFILTADGGFASHLVANGHHSRQTEIMGELVINDPNELAIYEIRKAANVGKAYFLFQAQSLDLPSLRAGQVLIGHIVESKVGKYEPKNIIVKNATYRVNRVLLNIENPFFGEQEIATFARGCPQPGGAVICDRLPDGKCHCYRVR